MKVKAKDIELVIDITIEEPLWGELDRFEAIAQKCVVATIDWLLEKESQQFSDTQLELSILCTHDTAITAINEEWRNQPKPTNVLSFPTKDIAPSEAPLPLIGDIVLAYETIDREAKMLNKPFDDHLSHLIIHGFLHLFGYDHINDEDATKMEAIETGILATLNLSDPYKEIWNA